MVCPLDTGANRSRNYNKKQPSQPLEKTMKKYLTFAAVLGAIAFLSVSYLAQADQHTTDAAAAPAAATTAVAADAAAAPAAAPEMTPYAKDLADCEALSAAAPAEGAAAPTAEEKAAADKKCMIGKGHTEEEIAKEDAAKKAAADAAAAAAPAAPTASEAPVAPEAPAAK